MSYSYIKNVFPNFEYSITEDVLKYNNIMKFQDESLQSKPKELAPEYIEVASKPKLEELKNTGTGDCDYVLDHVSKCEHCYKMIMKRMAVESDRIQREELLELASYIAFGIFVLMLVEYLKKN